MDRSELKILQSILEKFSDQGALSLSSDEILVVEKFVGIMNKEIMEAAKVLNKLIEFVKKIYKDKTIIIQEDNKDIFLTKVNAIANFEDNNGDYWVIDNQHTKPSGMLINKDSSGFAIVTKYDYVAMLHKERRNY